MQECDSLETLAEPHGMRQNAATSRVIIRFLA